MKLPRIPQSQLEVRPINWSGLTRRYMNPGELEVLIALVRSAQPRGVLEFGCNEGRTARAILDHVEGIENYQGIDVPPGYAFAKSVQRNEVPKRAGWMAAGDARFELLLRPRGSLELQASELLGCDVAFIDGDHGREAVLNDTKLARALVRPGGVIIWHDYHDLGTVDVRDVLDEMHASGAPIHHVEGTWLAFEHV